MPVSFGAVGTGAFGQTSVSPSYPAGITAGQLLLLFIAFRPTSATPPTVSGFTLELDYSSTFGTFGADAGPTRMLVYTKIASGSETGTLAITGITSGNITGAAIVRMTSTTGFFDVDYATGEDVSSGTGFSVATTPENGAGAGWVKVGDALLVVAAKPTDTGAWSAETIASTGLTMNTVTEFVDASSATGNDMSIAAWRTNVVGGAGQSSATVTVGATLGSASYGPAVVIRLRDAPDGATLTDALGLTDSLTKERGKTQADALGMSDSLDALLIPEPGTGFPLVDSVTTYTSSGSSSSIPKPAWTAPGAIALATGSLDDNAPVATSTPGWTLTNYAALDPPLYVAYANVDTATWPLVLTHDNQPHAGALMIVADAILPPLFAPLSIEGDSTAPNPPELDTGLALDYLWLALYSSDNAAGPATVPSGFGSGGGSQAGTGGTGASIGWGWRKLNASSLDPGAFSGAPNAPWRALTVAFAPDGPKETSRSATDALGMTDSLSAAVLDTDLPLREYLFAEGTGEDTNPNLPPNDMDVFGDWVTGHSNYGQWAGPDVYGEAYTPLIAQPLELCARGTLMGWYKIDDPPVGSDPFFSIAHQPLGLFVGGSSGWEYEISYWNGASYSGFSTGISPAYGEWIHVALTYDTDADTIQLYINGVLADTWTSLSMAAPTGDVYSGFEFSEVTVDDFRFFGKLLDSTEINYWKGIPAAATEYEPTMPGEALGITDSLSVSQTLGRTVTDPAALTDSLSTSEVSARSVADPLGLADSLTDIITSARSITDPLGLTDSLSLATSSARAQGDALGLGDSLAATQIFTKAAADAMGLADSLTAVVSSSRTITDAEGLTDALSSGLTMPRAASDSLGLTDSLVPELIPAGQVEHDFWGSDLTPFDIVETLATDTTGANVVQMNVAGEVRKLRFAVPSGSTDEITLWVAKSSDLVGSPTPGGNVEDQFVSGQWAKRHVDFTPSPGEYETWVTLTLPESFSVSAGENILVGGYNPLGRFYNALSGGGTTNADGSMTLPAHGSATFAGLTDQARKATGLPGTGSGAWPTAPVYGETYGLDPVLVTFGVEYSKTVTDDLGLADTLATAQTFPRTVSDAAGLADSLTPARIFNKTAMDPVAMSDSLSAMSTSARSVSDSLGLTDLLTTNLTRGVSISDGESIADLLDRAVTATREPSAELATITDVLTASQANGRTIADPLGLTDALAADQVFPRAASDALGLTDSLAALLVTDRTISDAAVLTDALAREAAAERVQGDGVGLADALTRVASADRTATDPLGLTDVLAAAMASPRAVADPLVLTDALTPSVTASRAVADGLPLADSLTLVSSLARTQNDPLGLADALTYVVGFGRTQNDLLSITDVLAASTSSGRSVSDAVGIDDSLTVEVFSSGSASISEDLAITDGLASTVAAPRSVADTLSLVDTLSAQLIFPRSVADQMALVDALSRAVAATRTITDGVALADSLTAALARVATQNDALALVDALTRTLSAARAASDSMDLDDELLLILSSTRTPVDTLELTDSLSIQLIREEELTDEMVITDQLTAELVGYFCWPEVMTLEAIVPSLSISVTSPTLTLTAEGPNATLSAVTAVLSVTSDVQNLGLSPEGGLDLEVEQCL